MFAPKPSTRVLLALLLALGCVSRAPLSPPNPRQADVYLIPMGGLRLDYIQSLARYYERNFSLQVEISPPIQPGARYLSSDGQQVIAAPLLSLLRGSIRNTSDNPRALMVAITDFDLDTQAGSRGPVFSVLSEKCCAVISTARIDPRTSGGLSTDEAVAIRMRKLVTRAIAFSYYGLQPNDDSSNILYAGQGGTLTLEELDGLDESTLDRDALRAAVGR